MLQRGRGFYTPGRQRAGAQPRRTATPALQGARPRALASPSLLARNFLQPA